MQHSQHDEGFTLIELMIAVGIGLLTLTIGSSLIHLLIIAIAHPIATMNDELALNQLEAQLRSDAQTAVIVPPTPGSSTYSGELQLAGMDINHSWHVWHYAVQQGLVRTTETGSTPLDRSVTSLQLRFTPTDQLWAPGALIAPLSVSIAVPQRQSITLAGQVYTSGIAEVVLSRGQTQRRLHLASVLVPTGFTIEHGPQWHAVLSRSASTSRSWLGFAQKTTYEVDGSITYSLDHWQTSHLWCKSSIYSGLSNGDPVAEQHAPNADPNESSRAVFQNCQHNKHQRALPSVPENAALQLGLKN